MNAAGHETYYDILSLTPDASDKEIKAAFRSLALRHHPDRNANSAVSEALFRVIRHAYETLSDPTARAAYDAYLRTSSAFRGHGGERARTGRSGALPPLPPAADGSEAFREIMFRRLNILLWDIEDLLRKNEGLDWRQEFNGVALLEYLLTPLLFIDRWILDAAGFSDRFWEARGVFSADRTALFADLRLRLTAVNRGWNIYVNVRDYFYDIRRRMNDFLNHARAADLLKTVAGQSVRIIDGVLEAQGITMHYLRFLKELLAGGTDPFIPYRFSHPAFETDYKNMKPHHRLF